MLQEKGNSCYRKKETQITGKGNSDNREKETQITGKRKLTAAVAQHTVETSGRHSRTRLCSALEMVAPTPINSLYLHLSISMETRHS